MVQKSSQLSSDGSRRVYPDECYSVAANELAIRIRLRENIMILSVTASLAIFGIAFSGGSMRPEILLIVPHIGFAATLLFAQQHSFVGALFGYFRDVGSSEETFKLLRTNPWHAHERFFNHLAGKRAQLKRFTGRSLLLHGPSVGALLLAAQNTERLTGMLWHVSMWSVVAAIAVHVGSESRRRIMYCEFAKSARRSDGEPGALKMPRSIIEKIIFCRHHAVKMAMFILIAVATSVVAGAVVGIKLSDTDFQKILAEQSGAATMVAP